MAARLIYLSSTFRDLLRTHPTSHNTLALVSGFSQAKEISRGYQGRGIPSTPLFMKRWLRVADMVGCPRYLAFSDTPPPQEFDEVPAAPEARP